MNKKVDSRIAVIQSLISLMTYQNKHVFKEFENNEFAKSIGETITSLKSVSSFVDLRDLASS